MMGTQFDPQVPTIFCACVACFKVPWEKSKDRFLDFILLYVYLEIHVTRGTWNFENLGLRD